MASGEKMVENDRRLNRETIKKLLITGLIGALVTGVGDFLLGYAEEESASGFAAAIMASAPNLSDGQMIVGGLVGFFGILLEGIACIAVYRLMADSAPGYARIYRAGIIGYIWLAPAGCHLNMGVLNLAYKYLLLADAETAARAAGLLFYGFSLPVYVLLVLFWLPMMFVQFLAFDRGLTPYPRSAKWFNVILGTVPAFALSLLSGPHTALGAAIGTMFLSFGNAFMFGGLLFTLPSGERFDAFEKNMKAMKV